MKKINIFAIILLMFFTSILVAQVPRKTDGDAMKAIITEIASDSFKGRQTGTDEGIKSEEYFAAQFKKLGLKPAGEKGTYFHTFSYSDYEPKNAELTIDGRVFSSGYDLDFDLMYYSDGGQAEGEIVFAGYGLISTKNKRNDFDSIDIKEKIVLMRRGCPDLDFDKWGPEAIDSVKAQYCYDHGAKAVLFYSSINYNIKQLFFTNSWIATTQTIKNFPIYLLQENVVKYILSSTKQPYYRMMNAIDFKNVSFNTGKKAIMKAETKKTQGQARNVLALIPGSDPKLKNEYIIIGGHLDHVGLNEKKEICNGADDNASGVAVTLGIAEEMIKNNFKPKRTIVFACWMGEEMGLLGSEAWCKNPTLDIYKTVVYFNLDMVGLGDGNLNMPGTLYAPEVKTFIKENTDSVTLKRIKWSDGGLGGSDHNYFLRKGIPAFAGMTSGDHPDYHRPGDDADKIKAEILQFVGDFIYHSTEILAQSKNNFITDKRFEENRNRLEETKWFTPINSSNFAELIEKGKPKLAIVDFSKGLVNNSEQNFISILKNYDNIEKMANKSKFMTLNPTLYDIVTANIRSGRSSLMASVKLSAIEYNELYTKSLSKCGIRIGLLDGNFASFSDSTVRNSFIKYVNNQNIGIVLDNPDLNKLSFVLEKSGRPVMVTAKINDQIGENILQIIRNKDHFIAFQINDQNTIADIVKTYNTYKDKLGLTYIGFTCDVSDLKSIETYKNKMVQLKKELGENIYNKITNGNFNKFFYKSLQDYPGKVIWRR